MQRNGNGRSKPECGTTVNVQNIPRDDKTIKTAIIPKLDALFFADYPNIELKLLAYYLNQIGFPEMAETFRAGADLHKVTASLIFNVPVEEVTDGQRQVAKRLNFSIVYGGGVPTLVRQGVAEDGKAAWGLLGQFHSAWPGIGWESKNKPASPGTLVDVIKNRVNERGYLTTIWGRHLHPRSMHSALNALIQGCAADLMKWALIEIHKWTIKEKLQSHLVNVVHDEAMLDAVKPELQLLYDNVPRLMTFEKVAAIVPIKPSPELSFTTWANKAPYLEVINA